MAQLKQLSQKVMLARSPAAERPSRTALVWYPSPNNHGALFGCIDLTAALLLGLKVPGSVLRFKPARLRLSPICRVVAAGSICHMHRLLKPFKAHSTWLLGWAWNAQKKLGWFGEKLKDACFHGNFNHIYIHHIQRHERRLSPTSVITAERCVLVHVSNSPHKNGTKMQ